jgi:hypothetical protein
MSSEVHWQEYTYYDEDTGQYVTDYQEVTLYDYDGDGYADEADYYEEWGWGTTRGVKAKEQPGFFTKLFSPLFNLCTPAAPKKVDAADAEAALEDGEEGDEEDEDEDA